MRIPAANLANLVLSGPSGRPCGKERLTAILRTAPLLTSGLHMCPPTHLYQYTHTRTHVHEMTQGFKYIF